MKNIKAMQPIAVSWNPPIFVMPKNFKMRYIHKSIWNTSKLIQELSEHTKILGEKCKICSLWDRYFTLTSQKTPSLPKSVKETVNYLIDLKKNLSSDYYKFLIHFIVHSDFNLFKKQEGKLNAADAI